MAKFNEKVRREELEQMNFKKDMRNLLKEYNVVGRNNMTKADAIEVILACEKSMHDMEKRMEDTQVENKKDTSTEEVKEINKEMPVDDDVDEWGDLDMSPDEEAAWMSESETDATDADDEPWPDEVTIAQEQKDASELLHKAAAKAKEGTVLEVVGENAPKQESVKGNQGFEPVTAVKMKYLNDAQPGAIIAFRLPNDKVISAALVKRSTKNQKLMVETAYGAQFIIKYADVVWVRSGKRWPKSIYNLLKGTKKDEKASGAENSEG